MKKLIAVLETAELSPTELANERISDGFQWQQYKVTVHHKFQWPQKGGEGYKAIPAHYQQSIRIVDVDAGSCVWQWGCDFPLTATESTAIERIQRLRDKQFETRHNVQDAAAVAFDNRFITE